MAVSTCSEGSTTLSAGSAVSDAEQHRVVQQMQQCFPNNKQLKPLETLVCMQPQCWQPRSSALQLQQAGSWPPLKQLASMLSRVRCLHDAFQEAHSLHVF